MGAFEQAAFALFVICFGVPVLFILFNCAVTVVEIALTAIDRLKERLFGKLDEKLPPQG